LQKLLRAVVQILIRIATVTIAILYFTMSTQAYGHGRFLHHMTIASWGLCIICKRSK